MDKLCLPAPAKLNLFLHINRRREDGYHELQTMFQLLDFGDELTFEPGENHRESGLLSLNTKLKGVPDNANLIRQAAELLVAHTLERHHSKHLFPVKVHLNKMVPMGGGLGGGSSDAATTLLALNYLWQLNISTDELMTIGRRLGADVPVFVKGRSAYAEGVGDKLQSRTIPEHWYLIIQPECHVSTARVFSHKELTRDTPKSKIAPALEGDLSSLALGQAPGKNDCESVVCSMFPVIREAMDWLNQYATARLTGTGACVFSCFTEKNRAHHVFTQLPTNYQGFVARGINQSPVIDMLSAASL